jgi:FkbM family methyltransferase
MNRILKDLARTIVKRYTNYFPIRVNGEWYYVDPVNVGLAKAMMSGTYERTTTKLFKDIIRPGWNILDVGGYVGYYTVIFSKVVQQTGNVFVVEPDPTRIKILKKNIKMHKLSNVFVYNLAVSDKKGSGTLYVPEINTSDARLFCAKDEVRKKVRVKIETLDNLFFGKLQKIDLIKMDIQGFEGKALNGARKLLLHNKNIYLHLEFWSKGLEEAGTNPKKIITMLEGLDFKIFAIDDVKKRLTRIRSAKKLIRISRNNPAEFVDILCKR